MTDLTTVTGSWMDLYDELEIAVGSPLLIYVDSGAIALAVGVASPDNLSYDTEAIAGEEVLAGGLIGQNVYARATSAGAAEIRARALGFDTPRKASWFDPRVINGEKALTVQTFDELNSKQGTQFEASAYIEGLAADTSYDVVFTTGDIPTIIKSSVTKHNSSDLWSEAYRAPTFSGGTPVLGYNFNDVIGAPPEMTILAGVTVTDPGTLIRPRLRDVGTDGVGVQAIASIAGGTEEERVLRPNTSYLLRFHNANGVACNVTNRTTWHEGTLSTETP